MEFKRTTAAPLDDWCRISVIGTKFYPTARIGYDTGDDRVALWRARDPKAPRQIHIFVTLQQFINSSAFALSREDRTASPNAQRRS